MNRTVLQKATNSRDKIYGLFGLTSDGSNLVPSPNYRLPVGTALDNARRAIAISDRTLDALATKMPLEELVAGDRVGILSGNVVCGKYPVDNLAQELPKSDADYHAWTARLPI